MDFSDTERALDEAAEYGQDIEFEALQDVAVAWSTRHHAVDNNSDNLREFSVWYLGRLIVVRKKIMNEIQRLYELGPPYQLRKRDLKWKMEAALAKIDVILVSLPEISELGTILQQARP